MQLPLCQFKMSAKRNSSLTPSSKPKKPKYQSKFQASWSSDHPWVKKSTKGEHFAFCSFCCDDLSVSHGGLTDITRHSSSDKHNKAEKTAKAAGLQVCNVVFFFLN